MRNLHVVVAFGLCGLCAAVRQQDISYASVAEEAEAADAAAAAEDVAMWTSSMDDGDKALTLLSLQNASCKIEWDKANLQLTGKCAEKGAKDKLAFRLLRQGKTKTACAVEKHLAKSLGHPECQKGQIYKFAPEDMHHRFALEIRDHGDDNVKTTLLLLYVPSEPKCEHDKVSFSAPKLDCSQLDQSKVKAATHDIVEQLTIISKHAFAVELETVFRRPPESLLPKEAVGRWAAYDAKYNGMVKNLVKNYFSNGTWESSLNRLVAADERKHYQKVSESFFIPAMETCFRDVVAPFTPAGRDCSAPDTCGLSGFCSTATNTTRLRGPVGSCRNRIYCKDPAGVGNACAKSLTRDWGWTFDSSVLPMNSADSSDADQWDGVPIEVIAPGPDPPGKYPLRSKSGLRNVAEMLSVLKHMGIQMGPSTGMHVHVNVQSKIAGGACCLTNRQIARVWAAFAKYQLVMDEFETPSRVHNAYAVGSYMGDARIVAIFANIHDFVNGRVHHKKEDGSPDFCNSALGVLRDPVTLQKKGIAGAWGSEKGRAPYAPGGKVCKVKGVDERYTALNLQPLNKMGTIEFRRHAGTHDVERVLRHVQFVTTFVETFKDSPFMDKYFDSNVLADWKELFKDQVSATSDQLFDSLQTMSLDKGSKKWFKDHQWTAKCPTASKPTVYEVSVNSGFEPSPLVKSIGKL